MAERIEKIIDSLSEVQQDPTVPKNVRDKIADIINTLRKDGELSIKIHKVLNELDEIAGDINLQPYTRTLVWNIVSELEKI